MPDMFFSGQPGTEGIRILNEMYAMYLDAVANASGYSPKLAVVSDGARRVHYLYDWEGTGGNKPTLTGYLGATGIVSNIANAVDIRGPQGLSGPANSLSIGTVSEGAAAASITGTAPTQTLNLTLPKGNPGTAATVTVGSVTSGASPAVTNSGTSSAAVLDFVLVKGDKGDTGDTNSLSIGTVTDGATAAASITGTAPTQTLNLVLPKGDAGDAATITVGSVTTGAAGSSASVTNSGTSSAAVLDFVIPRGDTGAVEGVDWADITGKPAVIAAGATATEAKTVIGLENVSNTSDADKPLSTAATSALADKVDKVSGKGLSTEDYTTAEKSKLAGIDSGATANTGTVTSVALAAPTGLSVSNSPVTTTGTLTLSFTAGYSIPTDTAQSNWNTAYGWGNHATAGYLTTNPALGTPTSGTLSNCRVDGTNEVGFKNIPQNSQSAAYTLVASDAGKHIFHPGADTTARTYTIPSNASVPYPIGTAITFINQNGTGGVVTIAITSDTMRLAGAGTTGSRTLARNGIATALKITATEWIISGVGLT